jgi:hypothetical protein
MARQPKNIYVEPRNDGKFEVLRPNADRASAVRGTQTEAIAAAKRMFPDVKPDVARVRHTKNGSPDQFRKG